MALVDSLGQSLLGGYNAPGLKTPVFSYPGSTPSAPKVAAPQVNPSTAVDPELARLQQETKNLQLQLQQQARLPTGFNYATLSSQAKQQATNALNPIYQKKLNDYLTQATVNQQRTTEDFNTANTNLDTALKNALEAGDVSKQRTSQDVSQNLANITTQDQNYQQDSGQAFDQLRNTLATGTATSGLQASGLGAQQTAQGVKNRNTQESRQSQAFQQAKDSQELLKTRSFEDIARSGELAKQQTTQGKSQAQTAFNRFLEDYNVDLTGGKQYGSAVKNEMDNEALARQDAINQAAGQYYSNLFNQYKTTLANKGARGQDLQLLQSIYGGYAG